MLGMLVFPWKPPFHGISMGFPDSQVWLPANYHHPLKPKWLSVARCCADSLKRDSGAPLRRLGDLSWSLNANIVIVQIIREKIQHSKNMRNKATNSVFVYVCHVHACAKPRSNLFSVYWSHVVTVRVAFREQSRVQCSNMTATWHVVKIEYGLCVQNGQKKEEAIIARYSLHLSSTNVKHCPKTKKWAKHRPKTTAQ
jgi:hypothetical protein